MVYTKAVFRGKCMALNSCIRTGETSQTNNLSFYFKKIEKEQNKPKSRKSKQKNQ